MIDDTTELFRPVGQEELLLIQQSGNRGFPPRLPEQPIFYPVLNEEYASHIAREWNSKREPACVGYVIRFSVNNSYLARHDVHIVGAPIHQEYWIPAEELQEFNRNILGEIEVVATFRDGTRVDAAAAEHTNPVLLSSALNTGSDLGPGEPGFMRTEIRRVRIGGVLIFVAIGLCLSSLQNLTYFLGSLLPVAKPSIWNALTNSISETFHPHWKPFLIFQLIHSSFVLFVNVLFLVLFFRKSRVFPKLMVWAIPLIFALSLVAHFWSGLIPAVSETAEYSKSSHALLVQFIALHVWIPYFLVSKRVKETFVY